MSTRIPLTDELLHEALRVPAGTEAPEAIVPEVMARVLQTLPSRSPRWLSGSLARRTGALAVVVVAIALALVSVTFLRRSPTTRVGGPTVIGPAVVAPPTSRYGTVAGHLLWLPTEGGIARVDRDTLAVQDTIPMFDDAQAPVAVEAVVATDAGVWAVLPRELALVLLDTTTGAELRRVGLDIAPYALAVAGPDLWVASFDGAAVLRLDAATGAVLARIDGISGPSGITVSDDAVWVAANGSSRIVRIDPATDSIAAQAIVGAGRPHSITAGVGGIWTANGTGRSVSHLDPATDKVVATIPTPDIAYDVEVVAGSVWVTSGPASDCQDDSELARIDPTTDIVAESIGFPCAWALIAEGDALWVNGEDDRGTLLAPVVIGAPVR
jgi:DNA-binding beta-propeller fold protein YncE